MTYDKTQNRDFGAFDRMYENVGADKAYYMACAFTTANTPEEMHSNLRMLRAVGQLDLLPYLDGCWFSPENPNGWDDELYPALRDQAWGFREYMEANGGLMGWAKQL